MPGIVLYPTNSTGTSLLVQIINNATVIALRYVASTTTNVSITFTNKSTETVALEINSCGLPIKAVVVANTESHSQGDFISTDGYVDIPHGFSVYDRTTDGGVLLRVKKVYTRHTKRSSIYLLTPHLDSPSVPWYPRINNGSFTQKYKDKLYHFYIPEYDSQAWSLEYGKPFKDLYGIQPIPIDTDVYQLPRYPVYWNGQNLTIYNKDLAVPGNVITDIDTNNGIIYLNPEYNISKDFTIDYTYLENCFIYKEININGHFSNNPLILEKFVVIYMIPAESANVVNKRTVFHAAGNSIEEAIASISTDSPDIPIAIIGAYSIHPVAASDNVNILDTRSKGGGLRDVKGPTSPVHKLQNVLDSTETPIEDLYDESYRFWDIGHIDGEPYPGAAAVAVDLPDDLKEILPISDIQKKASKFLAAGVYPSIRFTDRPSPAITGMSCQTSCGLNLDFSDIFTITGSYTTGVGSTIPNTASGAGWFLDSTNIPRSALISSGWDVFNPQPTIRLQENSYVLEVNTNTGVSCTYLKGTSNAEISWEERIVSYNGSSVDDPITYGEWNSKRYLDTKECTSGHLIKNYLHFPPSNQTKQYRNVSIYSPYRYSSLSTTLESGISQIIDSTLSLLNDDYEHVSGYTNISSTASVHSDYVLSSNEMLNLYSIAETPLEVRYAPQLAAIGNKLVTEGTYQEDHFFRYYSQNVNNYIEVTDLEYYVFDFNRPLKTLNKYLDFKYRNSGWSAADTSGASSSTGLVYSIVRSTGVYGSYRPGLPVYWTYFNINQTFSGITLATNDSLTEIVLDQNNDFAYSLGFEYVLSSLLSFTGRSVPSTLNQVYNDVYNIVNTDVIANVNDAVYGVRTLSGYDTTSHWALSQNRVSTYLGNNLYSLIQGYEYMYKYNTYREYPSDITQPTAAGAARLQAIFSGIESVLLDGYDAVYNNVLRGGLTEPDVALTLYGYGWYLNNWYKNYGICSTPYTRDFRSNFSGLFTCGLKQLIKNQFTEDGLLEIKSINGSPGPFRASVPSKILYPLGEALRYNYEEWKGVSEGIVRYLIDTYSVSGLYYQDPFKQSTLAGKEDDVLGGLSAMYRSIAGTGSYPSFEPISQEFNSLRSTQFLPNFYSYDTGSPTGTWAGVGNELSFWKYYHSGDVESSIAAIKDIGINCININLDYMLWIADSSIFTNNLDHLFRTCYDNRVKVIPSLFATAGTSVPAGQETAYYGYGHTGGRYTSSWIREVGMLTGNGSGETYVTYVVNRYKNEPALLGWSPFSEPVHYGQAVANCSSVIYLISSLCDNPIIYNASYPLSQADLGGAADADSDLTGVISHYYGISSYETVDDYAFVAPVDSARVSAISIPIPCSSSIFLENINLNKTIIASSMGDGTYNDYELAVSLVSDSNLPVVFSNLFIKSGTEGGCVYNTTEARNVRQVNSIEAMATSAGIATDNPYTQLRSFTNRYFYHSGYVPSYTAENLISEITGWANRSISTPFSSANTGEYVRQIDLLNKGQTIIDYFNYSYWGSDYVIPRLLSNEECHNLDYYRSTWALASGLNYWTISGEQDLESYDNFLTSWGTYLGGLYTRLNIDG
jgi:hypothetical protein